MKAPVLVGVVTAACGALTASPGGSVRSPPLPELGFVQERSGCSEVRVMRADGTHVRRVVPCSFGVQSPRWSPDGRNVVFVDSKEGRPHLYVVGADGQRRVRLPTPGSGAGDPVWSPDGTRLAYVSGRSLLVANADGRRARTIARAPLELDGPSWSPDGRRIVYAAGGQLEDSFDLYVATVTTGKTMVLVRDPGDDVEPAWSPDGETIAYVRRPPAAPLGALVVVRADGSGHRTLLRAPRYGGPAWSPGNLRLAVVSGFESAAEIYTLARNGDDLRRVTRNRFADREPDWRPSASRDG